MIPTETILALAKLAQEHQLEELSLSTPQGKLAVSRQTAAPQPAGPAYFDVLPVHAVPVAETKTESEPESDRNLVKVVSPLMGVFYRAASPNSPAFVEVGDSVTPGEVLCIVEAMKVMNEIVCENVGVIEKILPKNGDVVEAGATLFLIRGG